MRMGKGQGKGNNKDGKGKGTNKNDKGNKDDKDDKGSKDDEGSDAAAARAKRRKIDGVNEVAARDGTEMDRAIQESLAYARMLVKERERGARARAKKRDMKQRDDR
jgi:hypothetical protein